MRDSQLLQIKDGIEGIREWFIKDEQKTGVLVFDDEFTRDNAMASLKKAAKGVN